MFSEALSRTLPILDGGLSARRVVVLGDLMLDRFLWGSVRRISPEAPVPVVRMVRQTEMAGGAGNVVRNLLGLGLSVSVGGCIGDDVEGDRLLKELGQAGVDTSGVIRQPDRPTITKSRIIGEHQQMLRLDVEGPGDLPAAAHDRFLAGALAQLRSRPDAVVLSDYNKGVLSAGACRKIIAEARRQGIPVLADPKGRDYDKYSGATTITPNRAELAMACGLPGDDLDELSRGGQELLARLDLDFLTLTLGELGIIVIEPHSIRHIPTMAKEVFDVSGAGDTVIATLAAGLVAGLPVFDAVNLANLAAGIVVGKLGTAPIERTELSREIRNRRERTRPGGSKSPGRDELLRWVEEWRRQGQRIVFTNGCFDILHAGHVTYLEEARALGDRLILGLNSDASVRRLKGSARPINCQEDRARVLGALACVDAVLGFDEDTPLELIRAIRPDVLVKGGDYDEPRIVGAPEVRSWGGDVRTIPLLEGRSTTRILDAMNRRIDQPHPGPHMAGKSNSDINENKFVDH